MIDWNKETCAFRDAFIDGKIPTVLAVADAAMRRGIELAAIAAENNACDCGCAGAVRGLSHEV